MSVLRSRLEEVDRAQVINGAVSLIDAEVGSKSGLSGVALKGGYKVVKKLNGGKMIDFAVDKLLDDFSDALSPIYETFLDDDGDDWFETYIQNHLDDAANALLGITDQKVQRAEQKVIKKTYEKLRPSAEKHVVDALPGVGRLIDDHAPKHP